MTLMNLLNLNSIHLNHFPYYILTYTQFLNSGFSLATLQNSGNSDSEIERFMRSVIGLDSIFALSLRKVPDIII